MDQNTLPWLDPTERLPIVRTNSFMLGRQTATRTRIDVDETEPDLRVYVNREEEPAMGSITVFHPSHAIPPSLTPTGIFIVYTLREQLPRSPLPLPAPAEIGDLEYRCYFLLLQQSFYGAMQDLKCADAELERGREHPVDGRHLNIMSETDRRSIALRIVWGLRLLQTPAPRPPRICLLCNRPPASPREPEDPPEGSREPNILMMRSPRVSGFGLDDICILPPIREDAADGTPMLCGFHRYVFFYLMYQVVSPSWPVPYLQEDMATYGEIGVARWNPVAQMWQIQEPTGS